jgi:uncharacterized protein YdcH (DUF465 family)
MSVHYFQSLLLKAGHIQQQIEAEHKRQLPNWIRLLKLKKVRLAIKDRLARLVHNHPLVARRLSAMKPPKLDLNSL